MKSPFVGAAAGVELAGWGRYPVGRAQLRAVDVWSAAAVAGPRLARGMARSYGDASFISGGTVLDVCPRNRLLEFDANAGRLRAEAGATFAEILEVIVPAGWFVPVTPGTKYVTLGGCVAADVHGKNHHVSGNLSNFVESLTLLLADGTETRCSAAQPLPERGSPEPQQPRVGLISGGFAARSQGGDCCGSGEPRSGVDQPPQPSELFWATCGGMGLTGVIKDVTLRLRKIETSAVQMRTDRCQDLDTVMALLTQDAASFHYSVAWIDCLATGASLGRSVVFRGDHARLDELPAAQRAAPLGTHRAARWTVPFDLPGFVLSPLTVRAFNALYYRSRREGARLCHYDPFFYPLDAVREWNRGYGRRGFVQYQCVLPHATSREGLVFLLEEISRAGHASFLAVLKTMGAESGPLGFPLPGFTLALDIPMHGPALLALLDRLDERVAALGGRVYLAKDSRMNARWLPKMYPRLDAWRAVKKRIDPQNVFVSDLARRLQLIA